VKRRCAGCNRVIDGRPNKLYCSEACRKGGYDRRQSVGNNPTLSGAVPSVIRGSNGVLIAAAARLGYLDGPAPFDDAILDLTYGRGAWWTRYNPGRRLSIFDGDFTDTGIEDDSFPIIGFDPPYISTGTKTTSSIPDFYDRYGIGELSGWQAIRKLMECGLGECARILAPGGWLLFKCMNYVESGRRIWNVHYFAHYGQATLGLRLVDEFIHVTGGGAQPQTNLDGTPRQQKHTRQVHSNLLIFTKGRN
jgi:hypothetical protein